MYAIVDIETTGGHASANGITEVAILIHDGKEIIRKYSTLINPLMPIPVYIQALTGIDEEMVSRAPTFNQVANEIYSLLQDKVFVAHNVNFDFSFLRYHLAAAGYVLQTKKVCTVRLSRKIMPGFSSYSLGKLCKQVGIDLIDRHRAMGDASATACLFTMLLERDTEGHIQKALNQRSKEQSLPPHLPKDDIDKLPSVPGIYYFHNSKAKVVYVGKAIDIRKRVNSHFANNKPGRQKQDFLRDIHHITFAECATELMAFILEAVEIKRLWPAHNRALKRFEHAFGLYVFEDQNGYLRLAVDKRRKFSQPVYTFNSIFEGYALIKQLVKEFNLCPKLCFIQRNNDQCLGMHDHSCFGACEQHEIKEDYNSRVLGSIDHLNSVLPSFAIVDKGRTLSEKSCILMEKGIFYGMGFIPEDQHIDNISSLKDQLTIHPSTDYIRNMIQNHALKHPQKLIYFDSQTYEIQPRTNGN
ncbi:exonuclease domain-containing protein [Daejeonella lutea]|uniref:DNA polymerase-3 subunit epsilon n=1 Tax=Daejeonella lutea TaxID=572036 RepID=A0A1T5B5U5_9SPHI|nr:exonuclease domain-containing protein [Daejeonella lutea]SKB42586.1 DNA polymerase-3 subunit epsilon [Daejeonella lutea]